MNRRIQVEVGEETKHDYFGDDQQPECSSSLVPHIAEDNNMTERKI